MDDSKVVGYGSCGHGVLWQLMALGVESVLGQILNRDLDLGRAASVAQEYRESGEEPHIEVLDLLFEDEERRGIECEIQEMRANISDED